MGDQGLDCQHRHRDLEKRSRDISESQPVSARALFQCQPEPFSSLSPFPLALFPLTLTFCSRHHLMMIWMRKVMVMTTMLMTVMVMTTRLMTAMLSMEMIRTMTIFPTSE